MTETTTRTAHEVGRTTLDPVHVVYRPKVFGEDVRYFVALIPLISPHQMKESFGVHTKRFILPEVVGCAFGIDIYAASRRKCRSPSMQSVYLSRT